MTFDESAKNIDNFESFIEHAHDVPACENAVRAMIAACAKNAPIETIVTVARTIAKIRRAEINSEINQHIWEMP